MPVASDAPAHIYLIAWVALLAVCGLYIVVGIALRWRPGPSVHVIRYDPPQGISPAIAAFLLENGRYQRSFATALISLASKGYLGILQKSDWVTLKKLRDSDPDLPAEESTILSFLFPSAYNTYSFNGSDTSKLFAAYLNFKATVRDVASPSLISTHNVLWLVGLACSLTALGPVVLSVQGIGKDLPLGSIGFLILLIFVGGSCFVAALRVWPATLRKLVSLAPGKRRPRRPLNLNDAIPIYLMVTSGFGFMFLATLTSTKLASLVAAVLMMNVYSRYLLNAPTIAGRKALAELQAFREFLSRTDSDRLNHQNDPGKTPNKLEPYTPYAVALAVEHGWGEEFAGNLLEMLEIEQAYSPPVTLPVPDDSPEVLDLFNRKK